MGLNKVQCNIKANVGQLDNDENEDYDSRENVYSAILPPQLLYSITSCDIVDIDHLEYEYVEDHLESGVDNILRLSHHQIHQLQSTVS